MPLNRRHPYILCRITLQHLQGSPTWPCRLSFGQQLAAPTPWLSVAGSACLGSCCTVAIQAVTILLLQQVIQLKDTEARASPAGQPTGHLATVSAGTHVHKY